MLAFVSPYLHAQWPTSALTDDALVINYGIQADVVVFDDGSSIFSHGVENTVYIQKFDPYGYRVWPGIVVAHDNDSSNTGGGAPIVSDGDGGVVMGWNDYRGAYWDPNGWRYLNDGYYMQRVDRDGNVLWAPGGVLVLPPDSGFRGLGALLTDGAGGGIFVAGEQGFGYPGAPSRERLLVTRIRSDGQKLWDVTLESATEPNKLGLLDATRAGRYVYVDYLDYRSSTLGEYFTWVIDTAGVAASDTIRDGFNSHVSWRDSILYSISYPPGLNLLQKIASDGDTVWSRSFLTPGNCQIPSPFENTTLVVDGRGGMYYIRGCRDTVLHFSAESGEISRGVFAGIDSVGGYLFPTLIGDVVLANYDGEAQRYDSLGTPLWGSTPIVYQNDPDNSYFENFWGDNNGGIIATFWTTSHGLSAQHTGRNGPPGIINTVDQDQELPLGFELAQNYPNPFNPSTRIEFGISKRALVSLRIFDVLGREIAELLNEVKAPGRYSLEWTPQAISSGVYFYRFAVGSFTDTKKLVVIR